MHVVVDVTGADRHLGTVGRRGGLGPFTSLVNQMHHLVELVGDLKQLVPDWACGHNLHHATETPHRSCEPIVNAVPHSVTERVRADPWSADPVQHPHVSPRLQVLPGATTGAGAVRSGLQVRAGLPG